MKRIVVFLFCIFICILLMGRSNNTSAQKNNTSDEAKAILMVIKNHPDFPSNPSDTILKKLPTGGPQGTTANVKFTTKVVKDGKGTYVVNLTKNWGITVNGIYVKSYWKYNVDPNGVTLLEGINNDNLPKTMK